ncbi:MAG TPA: PrsW family glutamic-type intramembrane protease [Polyangia bacterium]|jgi:RsiW-degrading membrane proteinase PrsW (M82 family)
MELIWLSLIPCLLWLAFFYVQDWYQREPIWLIGVTFVLGAASALVAFVVNTAGSSVLLAFMGKTFEYKLAELWLVVGPVEEFVKMGAVLVFVYRRPEFDEPVDGVIYAAAAALGFAALENVIYLARHGEQIIVLRGIFANSGHALDSALWGLALSKARAAPNVEHKRLKIILVGWLLAAGVHALYDTFCLIGGRSLVATVGMLIIFMIVMFTIVEWRLIKAVAKSPHRKATMFMRTIVRCPKCGLPAPSGSPCWKCGTPLGIPDGSEAKYCLRCGVPQQPGLTQCGNCGISLLEFQGAPTAERRPHFVRAGTGFDRGEIAYLIDKPELTVGKTLENDFVIEEDSVSKHHARLQWQNQVGAHLVLDLGATNGVYVNGQRVSQAFLQDGFEVRFGQSRYVYRCTGWRAQVQLPPPMLWQPPPPPPATPAYPPQPGYPPPPGFATPPPAYPSQPPRQPPPGYPPPGDPRFRR